MDQLILPGGWKVLQRQLFGLIEGRWHLIEHAQVAFWEICLRRARCDWSLTTSIVLHMPFLIPASRDHGCVELEQILSMARVRISHKHRGINEVLLLTDLKLCTPAKTHSVEWEE